jgi:hypothetical protein
MIKRIRSIFRKKRNDFALGMEFKGHKFYVAEPDQLESTRAIGFWQSVREFTLRITANDLDVIEKRMKVAINESNLADLGYLVNTMSAYRMMEASERTLLNVAQQFIFIDDEQNGQLTPENKELKETLFKNHEVKAFFLSSTWVLIKDLVNLSKDMEIEDYLKQEQVLQIERTFSSLIAGSGI